MKKLLLLIIFSLFISSSVYANTRSDIQKAFPSSHSYLDRVTIDVYVVTVEEELGTTKSGWKPFLAEYALDEVLRGKDVPSMIALEWNPSTLIPKRGEKYLVFVNTYPAVSVVLDAYKFTPEIRQQVVENLSIEDINSAVLLILFSMPLVSLRLFFMAPFKPSSDLEVMKRRVELIVAITLSVLSFPAYMVYNESVPIDYNIRVDLLIIYPLLLLATGNFVVALLSKKWSRLDG